MPFLLESPDKISRSVQRAIEQQDKNFLVLGKEDQVKSCYPVNHFMAVNFGSNTTRASKKIKIIDRIITVFDDGLTHLNLKPKKLISICSWSLSSVWRVFFRVGIALIVEHHHARRGGSNVGNLGGIKNS
jgi:hypothetical protein